MIGCTTIGGGAEAAKVAEQFATENVTGNAFGYAVLVLWQRNYGPRPQDNQGGMGL